MNGVRVGADFPAWVARPAPQVAEAALCKAWWVLRGMEFVSAVEVGPRCARAGLSQQQQTPSLTQELRLPASDFLSLLRFLALAWVSITSERNQPAASQLF